MSDMELKIVKQPSMPLTILERLLIMTALPPQGNIVTLRIVSDLRKNLGFTEDEIKKCNIRTDNGVTRWDDESYVKDIPIGEKALDVIVDSFKLMSAENKLTEQHIPLYERFVEKKD